MSGKIFVLDEIVVREADSGKLRKAYFEQYAPSARARGMSLEAAWRSPAVEIPGNTSTLRFIWSVPDVGGWWRMRLGAARANPDNDVQIEDDVAKLQWWKYVDTIAITRKRIFMLDCDEGHDV